MSSENWFTLKKIKVLKYTNNSGYNCSIKIGDNICFTTNKGEIQYSWVEVKDLDNENLIIVTSDNWSHMIPLRIIDTDSIEIDN